VALDRSSIQRTDFPKARRGYEPAAVDAHLRGLADEAESMSRAVDQPVAAAASMQVQRIIEAAEAAAAQLRIEAREETEQLREEAGEEAERMRAEAGEEAQEHVHRVSTAARELLERIGTLNGELGTFLSRMQDDAGRLSAELRSLERDVAVLAPAQDEDEAEPEQSPVEEPEQEEEPELEVEIAPRTDATRVDDDEAARLVALDMALAGSPREETERYLSEHYQLNDPDKLLDDVYTLAGS
jgi:DivIVA domain-containing protein